MTIMMIIHLKASERFLACSDWSRAIFNFQVQTMEKTKWRRNFSLSLPSECPRNFNKNRRRKLSIDVTVKKSTEFFRDLKLPTPNST